jgi:cytochrome c oxidase assembly factor CtaG
MDPVSLAILQSWDFRLEVLVLILLAGVVFTRGWKRLHGAENKRSDKWRFMAYWSGLLILVLSLVSPIDVLGGQLFAMHMFQHLLLIMIVPPLLLLANPFPFLVWGLPKSLRTAIGRWLRPDAPFRQGLAALTRPNWAWFAFVVFFIGWHDPNAYNAALQYEWVHDLEHLTFFFPAVVFWWQIIPAAPRLRKPMLPGLQIAFLGSVIPVNMLIGIALAFAQTPVYTYYIGVPRLWGLSVMQDQMLAGTMMWIPGSMMYLVAVLVLVARFLKTEKDQAAPLRIAEETR